MKKTILGGIATFLFLSFIHAQGVNEKFKTPFTTYQIDNSKCVQLTHTSGSKIFIQDNAFNSSNPKLEIRYREFLTPLDMLVNNIPMTTKENGKTYQLESGGMFEILAFQNGVEVPLLKGKKIEVQLSKGKGDNKMSKMEGFKMNNGSDNWNEISNQVKNQSVGNDEELWGSSSISVDEELMEFDSEWGDWSEGYDEEWQKQDSIRKVAFQAMEIDEMGFYNYDYKIVDVELVPIAANFKIDNKEIKSTIYVVYDDINSVYNFPKYTWENNFSIIKGKKYKMFTIDENGVIAKLKEKPNLNTIPNVYSFELMKEGSIPESKEKLVSILEL